MRSSSIIRHFKRKHTEIHQKITEEEYSNKEGEPKIHEFLSKKLTPDRFFTLFVATSTFSVALVENQYWKVYANFKITLFKYF